MAINNFKPFATAANANVMTQADWEALPALLSGFMAGKASSAQVNKAIRQASFIAAALAQYTANKSGQDVLDNGDLNGFISKMGTAFGKDFQALDATLTALAGLATGANKLPYFTGTDTAAQTDLTSVGRDIIGKNTIADILTYLGAVAGSGGSYPGDLKFKSVGTNPTERNGITLVTPTTTAPNGFANWMQSDWYDDKVLWGILRGGSDKATGAGIQVMGLLFSFLADGTMKSGNETVAFQNWVTNNYLEKTAVGSAAGRDVGTGTNQIPDMNSFQSGSNANGIWFRLPSGILIQFGMLPATNPTSYSAITFPTPFTETPAYTLSVTSATPVMVVAVGANITGITGIQTFNQAGNQLNNGVPWIAIGR